MSEPRRGVVFLGECPHDYRESQIVGFDVAEEERVEVIEAKVTDEMIDRAMDAWLSVVNVPGSRSPRDGFEAALEAALGIKR
jgi:hypothetical protein